MKLRNKKTGEIDDFIFEVITDRIDLYRRVGHSETKNMWHYNSLAELNEEWEDYEEPKDIWWLDNEGNVNHATIEVDNNFAKNREIGNYFKSKEEAEQAVRKLKAWKLLKDECDIKFDGIIRDDRAMLKSVKLTYDRHQVTIDRMRECMDALHLLFGGEE